MVRVKICGITSRRDAWAAVDAGADALGFVLHPPSPRSASLEEAGSIIRTLPRFVVPVAVVVNRPAGFVRNLVRNRGFKLVQMHGDETPAAVRRAGVPVMKAIRVRGRADMAMARRYRAEFLLFDSFDPDRRGGTGRPFPAGILRRARVPVPFFLAGGLNPENVRRAVRSVRPFGVDASSGVEARPGVKDHARVREFVRAAKAA